MCSASTAEYCNNNKGVCIGTAFIASLAYIDDIADVNSSCEDAEKSHANAELFAKKKKLGYSVEKCKTMIVNKKKADQDPNLFIKGEKIDVVSLIKYLGDIFNSKGNNADLKDDRLKRATATMVSIEAFMRDTSLGMYTICVYLILHCAIFLPSVLFNSQTWTNISGKDLCKLKVSQQRFLQKVVGVKQVANSFLFLELGVLPIKYELHMRQLSFLHHIINLDEIDPVKQVWRNQQALPRHRNWWSNIEELMEKYSLIMSEEEIKAMSKEVFKKRVKKAIVHTAFEELTKECKSKSNGQMHRPS